jgi:regulator of sirC expression with transglutaminase-like and TPR domain
MDATARWRAIVQGPEDRIRLDEAALLVSAHANPGLEVAAQLAHLDDLAARVEAPGADGVCALLFGVLGLRGDRETYDDPRNSYLDQVLARRLGIPISLSVLLVEIGRRCGVDLQGVGMPGHYLVGDPADPDRFIDAFAGGHRIDRARCGELLRAAVGPGAALHDSMLEATGPRATLARMLANLDGSFARRGDRKSLAWVTTLRLAIPGLAATDRLALARRATGLGWPDRAADCLDEVAGRPDLNPGTAERLRRRAVRLRASLN